jgi:hypothetical protein
MTFFESRNILSRALQKSKYIVPYKTGMMLPNVFWNASAGDLVILPNSINRDSLC